jgi:ureidoacrylate peracid hydrolase
VFSQLDEILHPAHTALVLIDMQNDFCRPDGWMAQHGRDISAIAEVIPRLRDLLAAARAASVKVIFIQQTTLPGGASDTPAWLYFKTRDGRTETDYTIDGSWGQEIVEELVPAQGELRMTKFRPSAFHGTSFDLILKTAGIKTTVIAGVITQGCVLASALDASFHGYYTVVVEDCVASFSGVQHENILAFLRSRYDVLPAASVIAQGGWS